MKIPHNNHIKQILVFGIRKGGTSLLASLLGGHSRINMASEIYSPEVYKLVGKPFVGVKYPYPHIKYDKRYSSTYDLLYRKVLHRFDGYYSGSPYSIKDFEQRDAFIIVLTRDKNAWIERMMDKEKYTFLRAELEYQGFVKTINKIKEYYHVPLWRLTTKTEDVLKGVCDYIGVNYEPKMLDAAGYNHGYGQFDIVEKK